MRFLLLLTFCLILFSLKSQNDSVMLAPGARVPDGIYLSYEDFRHNRVITKEQINSREDREQQEFITKTLYAGKFSATVNGEIQNFETKKIWGYFQNNTCYVNYRGDFYRVPVFGAICYLVANVTVVNPGFYDPRFGYSMGGGTSQELREFMMDYYEGVPTEFSMDRMETLLSRDQALYAEYKKLGRRKQKEQIYRFIRRYNDAHPIYFLR